MTVKLNKINKLDEKHIPVAPGVYKWTFETGNVAFDTLGNEKEAEVNGCYKLLFDDYEGRYKLFYEEDYDGLGGFHMYVYDPL